MDCDSDRETQMEALAGLTRELDERGKLPADLERGVLGEDLPYEALVDAREAALAALEVATQMLRSL